VTDSGKDIAKGTEKGAKVVVYSSEDAGKKGPTSLSMSNLEPRKSNMKGTE
jgi:hypothetical protein